jgi:hypothetical protein
MFAMIEEHPTQIEPKEVLCLSLRLLSLPVTSRPMLVATSTIDRLKVIHRVPQEGWFTLLTVYELFLTTTNSSAFTCADVLDLYLHLGSFETILVDEDQEQDTNRWCSRTTCGQEFWQILNQWIWNLCMDLGHHLSPSPVRLTELLQLPRHHPFLPANQFSMALRSSLAPRLP